MTADDRIETPEVGNGVTFEPLRTTEWARLTHDLPEPHEWHRAGLYYPAMAQRIIVDVRRVTTPPTAPDAEIPPAWDMAAVVISGGNYRNWAERSGGITTLTVSTRYVATHIPPDPMPCYDGIVAPTVDSWTQLPDWALEIAHHMVAVMADVRWSP